MKKVLMAVFLVAATALPASAGSITIDSTNCNNSGGSCYGLSWTLDVISLGGNLYQAKLTVDDDPFAMPDSGQVISAVSFKASNSVSSATLISAPNDTPPIDLWSTSLTGLNSSGSGACTGPGNGMVCSQTFTNPVTFVNDPLVWTWTFATSDTTVAGIGDELKIGAKLTSNPSQSGNQLSLSARVPEPTSLSLLTVGLLGLAGLRRRAR